MKEIKLYNEIKEAVSVVMEAEANAAAWKQEARERMKNVNTLIAAAKKINKGQEIDANELIEKIRAELTPAETPEENPAD